VCIIRQVAGSGNPSARVQPDTLPINCCGQGPFLISSLISPIVEVCRD